MDGKRKDFHFQYFSSAKFEFTFDVDYKQQLKLPLLRVLFLKSNPSHISARLKKCPLSSKTKIPTSQSHDPEEADILCN